MKIYNEDLKLTDFEPWSGAVDTVETIIEHGKAEEFEQLIEELYPNGLSETALNDILWHDTEWVYEQLRITED